MFANDIKLEGISILIVKEATVINVVGKIAEIKLSEWCVPIKSYQQEEEYEGEYVPKLRGLQQFQINDEQEDNYEPQNIRQVSFDELLDVRLIKRN